MRRRDLLKGAAAAAALAGCAAPRRDLREENALPGTTDWLLTKTQTSKSERFRSPWIEGYVSRTSLRAGETLDVYVSTNPPSRFTLDVYRMGYYGGTGGRLMASLGSFPGSVQADPEMGEKRLRTCRWEKATSLRIPSDWTSGVYLGKLTEEAGGRQSYVVFVVRDDRPCDVLVQVSDTTWSAYNRWPSRGALYDDGKKEWYWGAGVSASFDRPYGKYCQIDDWPLSLGSGEFLLWEFPLSFWLEKEGFDVSYCSNIDTHADPAGMLRAKHWVSIGHDEYWSAAMYANAKAAVAAGVNLAFLSANSCYGLIDVSDRDRTIERVGIFGSMEPGSLRQFPEMAGLKHGVLDEGLLLGNRTTHPVLGVGPWVCADEGHWLFDGAGMKNGDGIPGLVGWEWHGEPADIPGLQVVGKGRAEVRSGGGDWAATIYPGPKGNHVFSCGTIWWADGLSAPPGYKRPTTYGGVPVPLKGHDPRVQRITRNLLSH